MDYLLIDYATEKIIAFCESIEDAYEEQERYIEKCKRNNKCFDMYIYTSLV